MFEKSGKLRRRAFLSRFAQATLGGTCLYSTLGALQRVQAMNSQFDDYKSLVCIFLFGGNDSFNMLVPRSGAAYNEYATARQSLAVAKDRLLGISPSSSASGEFGFHPSMPQVRSLFAQGRLAVVGNVGALVAPLDVQQYRNNSVPLPPRLFSHSDQQRFWQTLQGQNSRTSGWAGRMADLLGEEGRLPMNISLAGKNLMQTGFDTSPYATGRRGTSQLVGLRANSRGARGRARYEAFSAMLEAGDDMPLFAQEYAAVQQRAMNLNGQVKTVIAGAAEIDAPPAENELATALARVAQLISAAETLGQQRQMFFVALGGWDTHSDQLGRHPALLSQLSQALGYFSEITDALGVADRVTTFTASDFGRTLTTNGDGSDHGWGSIQLVMGDAVRGGDIYGEMPSLAIGGPLDVGRGRILPTTAVDQYVATLAHWFGLTQDELLDVLPNLDNFSRSDLGFMA